MENVSGGHSHHIDMPQARDGSMSTHPVPMAEARVIMVLDKILSCVSFFFVKILWSRESKIYLICIYITYNAYNRKKPSFTNTDRPTIHNYY